MYFYVVCGIATTKGFTVEQKTAELTVGAITTDAWIPFFRGDNLSGGCMGQMNGITASTEHAGCAPRFSKRTDIVTIESVAFNLVSA